MKLKVLTTGGNPIVKDRWWIRPIQYI